MCSFAFSWYLHNSSFWHSSNSAELSFVSFWKIPCWCTEIVVVKIEQQIHQATSFYSLNSLFLSRQNLNEMFNFCTIHSSQVSLIRTKFLHASNLHKTCCCVLNSSIIYHYMCNVWVNYHHLVFHNDSMAENKKFSSTTRVCPFALILFWQLNPWHPEDERDQSQNPKAGERKKWMVITIDCLLLFGWNYFAPTQFPGIDMQVWIFSSAQSWLNQNSVVSPWPLLVLFCMVIFCLRYFVCGPADWILVYVSFCFSFLLMRCSQYGTCTKEDSPLDM